MALINGKLKIAGKCTVLYNPLANNGRGEAACDGVGDLIEAGETVLRSLLLVTDYAGLLASVGKDDALVLCGGDGTINRFANLTDGLPIPEALYYYPSGTGNDFTRDVRKFNGEGDLIPLRRYLIDLPRVIVNGKTFRFLDNVGYGIDGYCCEVGDQLRAASEEKINYAGIAIKGLLGDFSPVNAEVEVDGRKLSFKKVWMAPTMNGRYYGGGIMPTPAQDRLNPERKITLMVFCGAGRLRTLCMFPTVFFGKHTIFRRHVTILEGHDITVRFDKPTALQIDGETVLGVTSYRAVSGNREA